jgi:hypothetical protein
MEIKKIRYGLTVPYRAGKCGVPYRTFSRTVFMLTFKLLSDPKAVQFKVKTLLLQDQFDVIHFDIIKVDHMVEPATQHREIKSG